MKQSLSVLLVMVAVLAFGSSWGCCAGVGTSRGASIARPSAPRGPSDEEMRAARQDLRRGAEHLARHRWAEALDALRSAQQNADDPFTSLCTAQALWGLRRYAELVDEVTHFNVIYDPVRDRTLHERATALLERTRARLGALTLTVSPDDALVFIDGAEHGGLASGTRTYTLDVGRHTVEVRAPTRPASRFVIRLRPYETLLRTVTLGATAQR